MKKSTRRFTAVAAGIGIAPLIAIIPATSAFAHGYVSAPMSRQAQCAAGTVECGPIKWEPQSVEGPKGLQSCSGGNARFAELDDDGKPWRAAGVGRTATFTWTFTVKHRTQNYEYYVGGRRVAVIDGGGAQPPSSVTHTVDLGGVSGRQKVLAVWNIADTTNAFYSCIDVTVQ